MDTSKKFVVTITAGYPPTPDPRQGIFLVCLFVFLLSVVSFKEGWEIVCATGKLAGKNGGPEKQTNKKVEME